MGDILIPFFFFFKGEADVTEKLKAELCLDATA